ncbi:MAG: hypothetical protein QXS68_06270 [Candidatus Methanomethylicaceae archaeon]
MRDVLRKVDVLLEEKESYYGTSLEDTGEVLKGIYASKRKGHDFVLSERDFELLLIVARIVDKLMRIAGGSNPGLDAWEDIIGYAVLAWEIENKRGVK